MIGILPIKEAMRMASAQGYDLVEMASDADPPVCRILDYGKFLYEEKAKQQAAKKHQHTVSVRQMRLTLKISGHDFDTKIRKMSEFLEAKDRVKVTVRLRGREVVHKDRGLEMIERIQERLSDIAVLEGKPFLEGTTRFSWQAMFVPLKGVGKRDVKEKKPAESEKSSPEKKLIAVSEEGKS
jgi:translation initiation factor IF-3